MSGWEGHVSGATASPSAFFMQVNKRYPFFLMHVTPHQGLTGGSQSSRCISAPTCCLGQGRLCRAPPAHPWVVALPCWGVAGAVAGRSAEVSSGRSFSAKLGTSPSLTWIIASVISVLNLSPSSSLYALYWEWSLYNANLVSSTCF